MGPIGRMSLEPEELGEMFSATLGPAAALAFEAAVNAQFNIFFNGSTAGAHRSDLAAKRATQARWDFLPVIDSVAVTQDVAKEGVKFQWASGAVSSAAQRF